VESELSLQTKREFLQQMIPQYRKATTVKKKSKLLDAFTTTTGYNRKYPMWLLNHAQVGQPAPQHPRPRHYRPEVQHALFLAWHAANRICAKRLIPFLPTLPERCSSSRSPSAPSKSGMRPNPVFWKRTWWLIVAPTSRVATCTP